MWIDFFSVLPLLHLIIDPFFSAGGNPTRIVNKSLIDYIFTLSLEVALSFDLPMQIHTG